MDPSEYTEERKNHHPNGRRNIFAAHHSYIMNLVTGVDIDFGKAWTEKA
jgi:hypothetical protein